ncbi:MAG TPA: protein kinase [Solirubrobacter sp.]|nr:protein kinase [Solirubrobacter sp.]
MHVLEPGATVGNEYVIEAPISTGGMGAVYRARRISDGAPVAVKQPLEARHALRFEIEGRLLARLRHPRVVRVLDHIASEEHGGVLVMDLVRGPSLASLLDQHGPFKLEQAVEYAIQACDALAYIHAQQVVHRDVKPANLILTDDGIVLVDFGIARDTRSAARPPTGALGTPRFAAPEVLAGGTASPRSDVYSLAATLWALIAGAPPPFLERARLPDVPSDLDAALVAALEPDPYLRLPSAEAFARALGEGLESGRGASLAVSIARPSAAATVLETIVRSAAGMFSAAAASIAFLDGRDLVYEAAWGAGAEEIVGVRLEPKAGIAAHVAASGQPEAIRSCRDDPRFAASLAESTGYVPNTMLVLPLGPPGRTFGVLQILDRLDGEPFGDADLDRGAALAELAMTALDLQQDTLSG